MQPRRLSDPSTLPQRLATAYFALAFYGVLLFVGVVCLAWNVPAYLAARLLPRRQGERFGQRTIMGFFRLVVWLMQMSGLSRCDLRSLDLLRQPGGIVIAPNHPSLLDAMMIISRLPRVVCVMKAEILRNPFLGGGARLAGYIENGQPLALIKRSADAVRDGAQLLIFPEGTRTIEDPVNAFKGGFAMIAKAAMAPVQTVIIETNSPYLGKHWPILRRPEFPVVIRARLGRRFPIGSNAQAAAASIERYVRDELARPKRPAAR